LGEKCLRAHNKGHARVDNRVNLQVGEERPIRPRLGD